MDNVASNVDQGSRILTLSRDGKPGMTERKADEIYRDRMAKENQTTPVAPAPSETKERDPNCLYCERSDCPGFEIDSVTVRIPRKSS